MVKLCRNCADTTCKHTTSACLASEHCFKPKPKTEKPACVPVVLNDLLSCAEWHEKEAWSHREDCEYRGGPETELGAEALKMTEKHAKFANAIRAALGAR